MNQSSLSVTDVGKSSAALLSARGGSAKQSGEVAESESFLSKLGAIFKSEEKAEKASDAEVKTDQTEDKQSVDGKQPVADAESLENAKSLGNAKSAEAIAELELGDDAAEEATVEMLEGGKQATAEAGKSTSNGKKLDEAAVKMPVSATGTESQKAADAMKSGNELLGRLDESNQALKSPPGKGLPQSDNSLKIDSARVNSSEMDSGVKAKQDVMSKYIQLPETEKPKVDSNTYVDSNNYVEGKPFTQATSEGSVQSQVATGGDADAETKSVLGTEKSLVDSSLSKASSEYEVKSAQTPFDQQIAESVNVNSGVSSGNVSVQEAKINLDPVQPISSRQPGGKVEVAQQASQHSQVGSAGVNVVETEANPQEAQQSALHKFFPQSSGQQNINQQDIRLSEWQPQAGRTEALNQVVQEEAVTPEQIVTPEQMVTPEQIVTPEQKRTKIPVAE